ncbi:hypothetical protein BKA69DRAFT_20706 [Paraphysoderma sedebokerense]|nr:hypothetical protein BKA69DRAFT_20706 [Paraphysoderma sedebokerense]
MDDSSISLRLLNSLSLPKSVRPHQISVNSDYCAIPLTYEQSELIAILQLPDVFNVTSVASILEHAKVILRSHKSPVLLTKFSHRINNSVLLASASKNEILIWDLSKWSKSQRSWEHVKVIASDVGRCQYLSFLGTSFLAAAVDNICYVFDLKSDKTIKLEGHDGKVTAAEFFPSTVEQERKWLLSISEDRTFKIWDIHEQIE